MFQQLEILAAKPAPPHMWVYPLQDILHCSYAHPHAVSFYLSAHRGTRQNNKFMYNGYNIHMDISNNKDA